MSLSTASLSTASEPVRQAQALKPGAGVLGTATNADAPVVRLPDWEASLQNSPLCGWKGYRKHHFANLAATNLLPKGCRLQLVTGEVFELESDMGFYAPDSFRFVPKDSTKRFSVSAVFVAQVPSGAEVVPCLTRAEASFLKLCAAAGVPAMPLAGGERVLRDLPPQEEAALVSRRLEQFKAAHGARADVADNGVARS